MDRRAIQQWKQVSADYLQPLKVESSEIFIQGVMRKVRAYGSKQELSRWSFFARWAVPALALSMTSFAAVFTYAIPTASLTPMSCCWGMPNQECYRGTSTAVNADLL